VISKKYRLSEREVKKVLRKWKPFFSYWIVLNSIRNNLDFNRFAIVIWWKSVVNSVSRNFFRRSFYNIVSSLTFSKNLWYDLVFVVKKTNKLDSTSIDAVFNFKKDILFLIKKITDER